MPLSKTKLVVGQGRLFFDPFLPGTLTGSGERYLGNTPAFSVTRAVEQTKRVRSVGGRRIASDPIITSETYSAVFTTDNIDQTNVANWFGGEAQEELLPAGLIEKTITVKYGQIYDIGDGFSDNRRSLRIASMTAQTNGIPVDVLQNFDTSSFLYGRFSLRKWAPNLYDGERVELQIRVEEARSISIVEAGRSIQGVLRFQSFNIYGDEFEYLYPWVSITCSGSDDLKSEGFKQLTFDVEMYKIGLNRKHQYLRILPALTDAERAIHNHGASIKNFPDLEDILNRIVQIDIPPYFKLFDINNSSVGPWIIPAKPNFEILDRSNALSFDRIMQKDIPSDFGFNTIDWLFRMAADVDSVGASNDYGLDGVIQTDLPSDTRFVMPYWIIPSAQ